MSEHKGDIIKLSLCGFFLILLTALFRFFTLPATLKPILFCILYLVCGFEVIKEAAQNIINGEIFDENFLMCVASLGAFIIGQYAEAVFVMLFFDIGELFEHIATENSRKSIKKLLDIRPDKATVLKNGKEISMPSKDVKIGDIITVLPGERIPLDGIILSGSSYTDNSALTGESAPQAASAGDELFSGCINLNAKITIRVKKEFSQSTASRILSLVESSNEKKAKSQKFITKFSKIYTPAVCLAALLLAAVPPIITGDFKLWIYRALMFLVVSCPCALAVSVPLTYFGGIGAASRHGILIKGAQYLESAARMNTAVFDKTGTLTRGDFTVTAVHPENADKEEILCLAAIAEADSLHPIALSLKSAIKDFSEKAEETEEISGHGIRAVYKGDTILAGNEKLMQKFGIDYTECELSGSIIHIAKNGEYSGHIIISDTLKSDAKATVKSLNEKSIKTVMLTGDNELSAKSVAKKLGLSEYHAGLKPQDKLKLLEEKLNKNGTVAFIGDGINDAPVLAGADIGIAMGALGSDAAREAADIVFMNDGTADILKLLKISKRTQKTVKENITLSLLIKFGVLILSAFGIGVTNMWIASFADVGVLIICVLNAILSTRKL